MSIEGRTINEWLRDAHATRTVLFRRLRSVLIRAHGDGLIATTLNFDYEVRSAGEAFKDVRAMKIKGEMLDLARHIIDTKMGRFDPAAFDDRYDAALAELVKAKIEGRKPARPSRQKGAKVVDLMEALRQSAQEGDGKAAAGTKAKGKAKATGKAAAARPSRRRKAG